MYTLIHPSKNDRRWGTLRPTSFVKTIRYLLLIYVIPINDFVLEKRRMVFIYLPYSSKLYWWSCATLSPSSKKCACRWTTLHGAILVEQRRQHTTINFGYMKTYSTNKRTGNSWYGRVFVSLWQGIYIWVAPHVGVSGPHVGVLIFNLNFFSTTRNFSRGGH